MEGSSSSFSTMKEDVLLNIFGRLPIKSICKFRCLSKAWRSKLSDANLMRNKFKTIEDRLWAVFSNNEMSTESVSSCRGLSGYDGFSFRFLTESQGIDPEYHRFYILAASSNGLVLCAAVHDVTFGGFGIRRYFLCNPVTKESVVLPLPPPKNSVGEFSYGLVSDTDESAFKVVRTETTLRSNAGFEVDVYFSDLDEWRTYNVAYPKPRGETQDDEWEAQGDESISNVITHNGVVYWIEEDDVNRVVAYDLKTSNYECDSHQCNVFDVPILHRHIRRQRASSECLGVSGDSVCYAHIRKNVLRIWELVKDGEFSYETGCFKFLFDYCNKPAVWRIRHEITLPDEPEEFSFMAFSPKDFGVVILSCGDEIYLADIAADKPELIECLSAEDGESRFLHRLCVPSTKNSFKAQHGYSPFIVTPTTTAIPKVGTKNSIRRPDPSNKGSSCSPKDKKLPHETNQGAKATNQGKAANSTNQGQRAREASQGPNAPHKNHAPNPASKDSDNKWKKYGPPRLYDETNQGTKATNQGKGANSTNQGQGAREASQGPKAPHKNRAQNPASKDSDNKKYGPPRPDRKPRYDDQNSVRVSNLSEDTGDDDLLALFDGFGPVARARVILDGHTGKSRGFGFVNFVHKEDGESAITKMNGYGHDYLILRVAWAGPRSR